MTKVLKDTSLLSFKDGLVELSAEVETEGELPPETFVLAVRSRLDEDLVRVMTDPAILDPGDLAVASSIVSRDPLPGPLRETLVELGFSSEGSPQPATSRSSIFGGLGRAKKRARLERWRLRYTRAREFSTRLGELETRCIDELGPGELAELAERAAELLASSVRAILGVSLDPGEEGLVRLESAVLAELARAEARPVVLHPSLVLAIAAFAGESIRRSAPQSRWSTDHPSPLVVQTPGGLAVETDPELRVVRFVRERRRALLSAYLRSVVEQSLTRPLHP